MVYDLGVPTSLGAFELLSPYARLELLMAKCPTHAVETTHALPPTGDGCGGGAVAAATAAAAAATAAAATAAATAAAAVAATGALRALAVGRGRGEAAGAREAGEAAPPLSFEIFNVRYLRPFLRRQRGRGARLLRCYAVLH